MSINYTGVTEKTYEKITIGAGAIYKDFGGDGEKCLGATTGEISFGVEYEWWVPSINGVRGELKGTRYKTKVTATLEGSIIEMDLDHLKEAVPGGVVTTDTTGKELSAKLDLVEADYAENIAVVGKLTGSGKPIILMIKNAIGDAGISLTRADNTEIATKVKWVGTYTQEELDAGVEPWKIIDQSDVGA